jgi:serine/threonine protein kinase
MRRGTLRERLEEGQLTPEEAGEMLAQVADALQVAHERGVVHRDIKPSNILLADDEDFFYLADFGLAKVIEEASDITQTGCLVGTPEYMAPELTEKQESASSDIYALGILLYRMLAGQLPFRGGTPLAIYWKHLHEQPVPPSYLNAMIPYPIERVILRALEKDPANRYRTAQEMAAAYQQALTVAKGPGGVHNVAYELTPVHVEIKKTSEVRLPAVTRMTLWGDRSRPKAQKGIVASAAVLMLFVLPLSLGFIMARGGNSSTLIAGASANVAATSLRPMHPYVITPVPTPAASPVSTTTPTSYQNNTGASDSPVVVPPQKSHTHKHGYGHSKHSHKHGGDKAKQ